MQPRRRLQQSPTVSSRASNQGKTKPGASFSSGDSPFRLCVCVCERVDVESSKMKNKKKLMEGIT